MLTFTAIRKIEGNEAQTIMESEASERVDVAMTLATGGHLEEAINDLINFRSELSQEYLVGQDDDPAFDMIDNAIDALEDRING